MLFLDVIIEPPRPMPIPETQAGEIVSQTINSSSIVLPIVLAVLAIVVVIVTRKILKKEIKNVKKV